MLVLRLHSFHARCHGNHVMVPPTFRMGLPSPLNSLEAHPQTHPESNFLVILNPVKQTIPFRKALMHVGLLRTEKCILSSPTGSSKRCTGGIEVQVGKMRRGTLPGGVWGLIFQVDCFECVWRVHEVSELCHSLYCGGMTSSWGLL